LFVQNKKSYSESLFDSAVRKFGFTRALRLLDECLPSEDEVTEHQCSSDSVPLFVLDAASGDISAKEVTIVCRCSCWQLQGVGM
jgi:hypothetical protein